MQPPSLLGHVEFVLPHPNEFSYENDIPSPNTNKLEGRKKAQNIGFKL